MLKLQRVRLDIILCFLFRGSSFTSIKVRGSLTSLQMGSYLHTGMDTVRRAVHRCGLFSPATLSLQLKDPVEKGTHLSESAENGFLSPLLHKTNWIKVKAKIWVWIFFPRSVYWMTRRHRETAPLPWVLPHMGPVVRTRPEGSQVPRASRTGMQKARHSAAQHCPPRPSAGQASASAGA